jgi:hypothetical protein
MHDDDRVVRKMKRKCQNNIKVDIKVQTEFICLGVAENGEIL